MKRLILIYTLVLLIPAAVLAQGTGFSFQGRLNDGTNPASGRYDLQFRLYDAIAGGNSIGALISRPNTILINGVFSTTLDFGAAAFNNPNSIFIEIGVRPNGSPNAYTILGPRQQLTVVPFAIRATTATNADNAVTAQTAVNATTAVTATNALSLGGVAATEYARLNTTNTGDLRTTGNLILVGGGLGSDGNLSMSGDLTLTGSGLVGVRGGNLNIVGNAKQNVSSNGFVKASALVRVVRDCPTLTCTTLTPTILHCYNSVTNATTGNCGFSFPNVYINGVEVNFGFQVSDRFILLTSGAGATGASVQSFPNENTVSVLNGLAVTSEFYIFIF